MKRIFTLLTLLFTVAASLIYSDSLKADSAINKLQSKQHLKPFIANPDYASVVGIKFYPIEKVSFVN